MHFPQSPQQPLHLLIRRLGKDAVKSVHGPEEARGAQADYPVGLVAQLLDGVGRAHGDGQGEKERLGWLATQRG